MGPSRGRLAWLLLRGLFWLAWGPIILGIQVVRLWALRAFWRDDTIPCATCGREVPLLGLWQCGRCGYSWAGFYFARCQVCGDLPPYVECGQCGTTSLNPFIW